MAERSFARYRCRRSVLHICPETCGLQGLIVEEYFDVCTEPAGSGCLHIMVAGEVDLATSDVLFRVAVDAMSTITPGAIDLIEVDPAGVRLLDASAIGVLPAVQNQARDRGIRLRVRGATGLALRVLEITGALEQLGGKSGTDRLSPGPGTR